jgi:signal transduction histidine kinase
MRRILNDLRPGVLDHLGLWAALECLLQETETRAGLRCRLACPPEIERRRFGRDAEIAVFRIVQEVLTNVQRHAAARRVTVNIQARNHDLLLEIADDGRGMAVAAAPTTFGLLGMHERARAIGGELTIASAPRRGTAVSLRLPGVLA